MAPHDSPLLTVGRGETLAGDLWPSLQQLSMETRGSGTLVRFLFESINNVTRYLRSFGSSADEDIKLPWDGRVLPDDIIEYNSDDEIIAHHHKFDDEDKFTKADDYLDDDEEDSNDEDEDDEDDEMEEVEEEESDEADEVNKVEDDIEMEDSLD
ncbi:MAG: hypothetical protein LQ350_007321 [Teloschistes chrysophthalmus]|nr:MAG: hypothetical protein LQ350_007321 [Niorma chrysophthalma]